MRDTQRERERQRHRQREKQASCREPDVGLELVILRSLPEPKADAQPSRHSSLFFFSCQLKDLILIQSPLWERVCLILQGHLGSQWNASQAFYLREKGQHLCTCPISQWAKVHLTEGQLCRISRLHMSLHPHPSVSSLVGGSLHLCPRCGVVRLHLSETYQCPWIARNMRLRGSDVHRRYSRKTHSLQHRFAQVLHSIHLPYCDTGLLFLRE